MDVPYIYTEEIVHKSI